MSSIALAGATGIFLLWILDVLVYHRLLVAVTEESAILEKDPVEPVLPGLHERMKKAAVSRLWFINLSARRKISLFYGIPACLLSVIAVAFLYNGASVRHQFPRTFVAIGVWLALSAVFIVIMLLANRERG